jgi:DNA-binding MarR family transcriptional regulator
VACSAPSTAEARGRILDGISAEDYQQVVATVRRMAGNLA